MQIDVHATGTDIRWLDGQPASSAELGGKAYGLNRLCSLGIPVPRAAAIPVSVYRQFAEANDIPLRLDEPDSAEPEHVRERIQQSPLPEQVGMALAATGRAFRFARQRVSGGLAVRSSGSSEDSVDCAFAGLHDSLLNVDPGPALESALRHCWSSLWSDRAISYRRERGLEDASIDMAVLIQEMVYSDVSFVGFAFDPVSGNEDTVLITATWGLCEAVVAGLTVPDEIRVHRDGDVEYRIGSKHQMVVPGDTGVATVPVPRFLQGQPALDHATAREIAQFIRIISSGLGYPADVEGGIALGNIQFFQARPITTLPSLERLHHVESGHCHER